MWMLDTDTCSYVLKRHDPSLERMFQQRSDDIAISMVVYAELKYGAAKAAHNTGLLGDIREFVRDLVILPWDKSAAEAYGELRHALQSKGRIIGALDMMIAAHALSLNAVLVTNNQKHFKVVPGLKIENWV